jgi:hypothetical protein
LSRTTLPTAAAAPAATFAGLFGRLSFTAGTADLVLDFAIDFTPSHVSHPMTAFRLLTMLIASSYAFAGARFFAGM